METVEFLLLLFLGIISYLIVRRTAARLADTPVWLLWGVLMAPPIFLSVLMLTLEEETRLPFGLVLLPFILCGLIYAALVRRGQQRRLTQQEEAQREAKTPTPTAQERDRAGIDLQKAPAVVQPATLESSLSSTEEKHIRNSFPWNVYHLQALDYRPQAILCRGRLTTNPDVAYRTVRQNIESHFGDRFLLILQEGQPDKPFFALVPNPWAKGQAREKEDDPLARPWLALGLLLVTLFTTTEFGTTLMGISPEEYRATPGLMRLGLIYSVPLLTIIGCREFCHYLAAQFYRVRTTLPYFVPMPFFLGTFGAFIQTRSPMPHRKALFDVAIVGPLTTFILSVPILFWGLTLSQPIAIAETSTLLNFKSLDPRFSFLLAILSKLALGDAFGPEMAIQLHPLAIAGYLGLIITALTLMPVGQLDGGHIVHAMFGQRKAMIIGQVARLLIVVFAFARQEFVIWAIFLLFMPNIDEPALNDVTELDDRRDLLGLGALALLVLILLPLPVRLVSVLGL